MTTWRPVTDQDDLRAADVIRYVAKRRGVTVRRILMPCRWAEVVAARREVAGILDVAGWSYPAIGRALGGMHHTSVMYLLGAIKPKRAVDSAAKSCDGHGV